LINEKPINDEITFFERHNYFFFFLTSLHHEPDGTVAATVAVMKRKTKVGDTKHAKNRMVRPWVTKFKLMYKGKKTKGRLPKKQLACMQARKLPPHNRPVAVKKEVDAAGD
jgi:hypothetical protein